MGLVPKERPSSGESAPTDAFESPPGGSSAYALIAAALAAFIASLGLIGGDALWLVPLGSRIAHGTIPGSVPFATAPSSGWKDVPAGGELVFWGAYHVLGGGRGLLALQALAAALAFGALARGIGRQTTAGSALAVSAVALVGSLPAVLLAGASTFSLAFFPVLLLVLEREAEAPSRRIWLSVPLLAVWGNLHGGALSGLALLACYLVFDRARREPALAIAVLGAAAIALAANPELWHTPTYYRGVFESIPARDGAALWSPLRPDFGGVLIVAALLALVGIAIARRTRPRLWEGIALVGLLAATVRVERTGDWLLFVAAYPAARGLRLGAPRYRLLLVASGALAVFTVAALLRNPIPASSQALAARAARTGEPLLADAVLGQEAAIAGGRVWLDNPIDAFRRPDQRLYLDWLAGMPAGAPAISHAGYVLVHTDSPAGRVAAIDRRLALIARSGDTALYRVRIR
jgi:hypothetical protein